MHQKRFVFCSAAALLALAVACSNTPQAPVAPGATPDASTGANPDGSTLKATAPATISPVNGAQADSVVLVSGKSTGTFNNSATFSYEFEVRNAGGTTVGACSATLPNTSGSTVTYTPTCTLDFDANYTWRVRAVLAGTGRVGPWSSAASFKSPAGGYIRGNEIFDPLINGKTVGEPRGPITFIQGQGARLNGHDAHILYRLPQTLEAGEFSVMILGADEGSPGDKSKVFAMQEGPEESDITDDDYRMTAELRGNQYSQPGAVTFRIIAGEPHDGFRTPVNFDSTRWYFWRFTWRTGNARLEVRRDSETGPTVYASETGTGGHAYRPNPHYVYIGVPFGRAGSQDATLPGGTYKNLWVSSRPRPNFPN